MHNTPLNVQRLKHLIPAPMKRVARETLSNWTLRRAVRQISRLRRGALPTREMLQNLQIGWANEGFAATTDYLQEIVRAATTTAGPILECGSGLTSILLGLTAGRRGVETWSLEHMADWRERIQGTLEQFRIPNVRVCLTPLRDYGAFTWYEPPLADMPGEFRMVICDGPPGDTPGGRYGLLPILGHRLPAGSVILLDDARRPGEAEVLRRWLTEAQISVSLPEESRASFAVITRK